MRARKGPGSINYTPIERMTGHHARPETFGWETFGNIWGQTTIILWLVEEIFACGNGRVFRRASCPASCHAPSHHGADLSKSRVRCTHQIARPAHPVITLSVAGDLVSYANFLPPCKLLH